MIRIQMNFERGNASQNRPELVQLKFYHPLLSEERCTVRGKDHGAYPAEGSFQWTSGVQALCLFLVRGAQAQRGFRPGSPLLEGIESSPASALDYAICRSPNWLLDMFGVDSGGTTILRRIIQITNSCRKRPGPVAVGLAEQSEPLQLKLLLDDQILESPDEISRLESGLSSLWCKCLTDFPSFRRKVNCDYPRKAAA